MRKIIAFLCLFLLLVFGCKRTNETKNFQHRRNNTINVKSLIHEINLGDVLVSNLSKPFIAGNYLIIADFKAPDNPINLFDLKTFQHIVSFGDVGQGPKEITNMGDLAWNEDTHELYVTDHGKLEILSYNIDSILVNKKYPPIKKFTLNNLTFAADYYYINDTISYCRAISPHGNNDYVQSTGIWNMRSGEIKLFEYNPPKIIKKRFQLAVSYEDSIYAECNIRHDLVSLFNLDGSLIKNIYGPDWNHDGLSCFGVSTFTEKYLISAYSGEEYGKHTSISKCVLFSKNGDYIATLNLEYNMVFFCYDRINDRLIFSFDDDIQFGYLNISDLNLEKS